jgi:hypothetical protein
MTLYKQKQNVAKSIKEKEKSIFAPIGVFSGIVMLVGVSSIKYGLLSFSSITRKITSANEYRTGTPLSDARTLTFIQCTCSWSIRPATTISPDSGSNLIKSVASVDESTTLYNVNHKYNSIYID